MPETPIGAPSASAPAARLTMRQEFMGFLKEYGVIGLAIAVVIGGKLNALVSALVSDLLMPLIFQPLLEAARVEDIRSLQFHGIFYGRVVGAAIDFMIVALVVFFAAKKLLREEKVKKF